MNANNEGLPQTGVPSKRKDTSRFSCFFFPLDFFSHFKHDKRHPQGHILLPQEGTTGHLCWWPLLVLMWPTLKSGWGHTKTLMSSCKSFQPMSDGWYFQRKFSAEIKIYFFSSGISLFLCTASPEVLKQDCSLKQDSSNSTKFRHLEL